MILNNISYQKEGLLILRSVGGFAADLIKAALIKVQKPVIMHAYVLHGPNALIYSLPRADLQGGLGICSLCSLVQPGLGHIPNT